MASLRGGSLTRRSTERRDVRNGKTAWHRRERGLGCRLIRAGVDAMPRGLTGSQRFLEDRFGLSAQRLAATVQAALDTATA